MRLIFVLLLSMVTLSACTEVQLASHLVKQVIPPSHSQGTFKVGSPYKVAGKMYYPKEQYDLVETGIASWYGPNFHGKKTANGETFDKRELTAAHKTLQMPSLIRVTNLENGRSLVLRVNDRGPFKRGRILDVSERGAELLGFKSNGTAKIRLEVLPEESMQIAAAAKQGRDTGGYEVAVNRGKRRVLDGANINIGLSPSLKPTVTASISGSPVPMASTTVSASSDSPVVSTDTLLSTKMGSASVKTSGSVVSPSVGPVVAEPLAAVDIKPEQNTIRPVLSGHERGGNFYPDPVISEHSVQPSNIYIQAGSFTVYKNAQGLRDKLTDYATTNIFPSNVDGKKFYRVRLGPIASVEKADALLDRLVSEGNNSAMIVVE